MSIFDRLRSEKIGRAMSFAQSEVDLENKLLLLQKYLKYSKCKNDFAQMRKNLEALGLDPEDEDDISLILQLFEKQAYLTSLDDLVAEKRAPFNYNGRMNREEKRYYSFVESLNRLKSSGFERHLRPNEAVRVFVDALKNSKSRFKDVKANMLADGAPDEWLSIVTLRENGQLKCYVDPENLVEGEYSYMGLERKNSFRYAGEYTFELKEIHSGITHVDVKDLPEDLCRFLYSKTYERLPEAIRENGRVIFQDEGKLFPMTMRYQDFCIGFGLHDAASRGVCVEE